MASVIIPSKAAAVRSTSVGPAAAHRQSTPAFATLEELQAHYRAVHDRVNRAGLAFQRQLAASPPPPPTRPFRTTELAEEARQRAEVAATQQQIAGEEIARQRVQYRAVENRPTVTAVVAVIARRHGLTPGQVLGACQTRQMVAARWHVLAVLRWIYPEKSLPWLGRKIGGRDHTTARHALISMQTRIAQGRHPYTGRPR
jgi:non-ribosomal peptide synthetase component F